MVYDVGVGEEHILHMGPVCYVFGLSDSVKPRLEDELLDAIGHSYSPCL